MHQKGLISLSTSPLRWSQFNSSGMIFSRVIQLNLRKKGPFVAAVCHKARPNEALPAYLHQRLPLEEEVEWHINLGTCTKVYTGQVSIIAYFGQYVKSASYVRTNPGNTQISPALRPRDTGHLPAEGLPTLLDSTESGQQLLDSGTL